VPGTTKFDEEFSQFVQQRKRVRCYACQLPDEVREWVDNTLRSGASTSSVADFIRSKGYQIGASALTNHRTNHVPG